MKAKKRTNGCLHNSLDTATKPAACLPSAQCNLELPAAARKSNLPLSRFPRGKAWAGGFPPRRRHAMCEPKALAHIDAAAPCKRGFKALR